MKKYVACLAILALTGVATPLFAQYTGPTHQIAVHTSALASKAADDTPVTLEGYLIAKIRAEHYTFRDDSGVIEVEIDHKYFPVAPVNDKTKVRLHGKVDKDFTRNAKVDVTQVEILSQ